MSNPLYDPNTDNQVIESEVQKRINTPLSGGQLSEADRAFLDKVLQLVREGRIDLYQPSSLLNMPVYEALPLDAKAKADQNTVSMLSKVRNIVELEKVDTDASYQLENLVRSVRLNKERLEEHGGDIFII